MPITDVARQARALPIREFHLDDFTGGLDLRDRLDIGLPYLLQATNVDLTGGHLAARYGTSLKAATPGFTPDYFYFSAALGKIFAFKEASSQVAWTTNPNVSWTDASTGAPTLTGGSDAIDFAGALVVVSSSGVYSFDGTTWTTQTTAVTGITVASWQNKLWVAGVGSRVWRSGAGSYSSWDTTNDWIDIREGGSDQPVNALHTTQEMDVTGRPSLLVGKKSSLHRINSATTGAFTTLSLNVGVLHKRGIASTNAMTAFVSAQGIYVTNGVSVPTLISDRIRPMFVRGTAASFSKASVTTYQGRFVFSFSGWNSLSSGVLEGGTTLEWDPSTERWSHHTWSGHSSGATQGSLRAWLSVPPLSISNSSELLYSCDTTTTNIYLHFNANAADDAGVANKMVVQTPYFSLERGTRVRLQRLRLQAILGTISAGLPLTVRVRCDGAQTDTTVRTYTSNSGSPPLQIPVDFNRLGNARNVSLVFELPITSNFAIGAAYSPYVQPTALTGRNEIVRGLLEYTPTGRN